MRVGLTYDLRDHYLALGYGLEETAEFDRPETIDALEGAIRRLGHGTERIGTVRDLASALVAGKSWDLVFNIAEGLEGVGREAQVPALLEAYAIPYTFSDTMVMALALHKPMAKRVVRDCGVPTAPFRVVEDEAGAVGLDLAYPLFVKPIAEGTGKGISPSSRVESEEALVRICRALLERFRQPVLVETFLPGREFTAGIAGTGKAAELLAVMEIGLKPGAEAVAYSFVNKEECEDRIEYRLARDAEAQAAGRIALAAWRALGCRDAGRVDLRSDAHGAPQFLEANPLAGLHPEHSDLPIMCAKAGIGYDRLIGLILESASRRVEAPRAAISSTSFSGRSQSAAE